MAKTKHKQRKAGSKGGTNKGVIFGDLECLTDRQPTHELYIECYPMAADRDRRVTKRLLVRNTGQIGALVEHLLPLVGTTVTNVGWLPLSPNWSREEAVR